jgi:putative transcriptional regulator
MPSENDLRGLRFEHNEMTRTELAPLADAARQSIIAIEQNKYAPSLEAAFRIAAVFRSSHRQVLRHKPE